MKKKGFTLIELIAVIVVLAIITLIAVPIMSKVVDKARKGAAEASALNYIDAVEKYVILHDLDSTKYPYDLKNNTFNVSSNTEISFLDIIIPRAKAESTIPSLNSFIAVKGDKPKSGTITLNEKGKVTEAELGFGKYNVECTGNSCIAEKQKEIVLAFESESSIELVVGDTEELKISTNSNKKITWTSSDNSVAIVNNGAVTGVKAGNVTITAQIDNVSSSISIHIRNGATKVSAPSQATYKGIIYLNPANVAAKCDATNSISTTGTKTGCMKWYIYKETTDKYYMILDHNAIAAVDWYQQNKNVPYEQSKVKPYMDSLVTTNRWIFIPRLITADEVAGIVEFPSFVNQSSSWIYLDGTGSNKQTAPSYTNTNRSKYDWLFNYNAGCNNNKVGCTIEDNTKYSCRYNMCSIYGYWTSTPVNNSSVAMWSVNSGGGGSDPIYLSTYSSDSVLGVRPVIEVDKSIIN